MRRISSGNRPPWRPRRELRDSWACASTRCPPRRQSGEGSASVASARRDGQRVAHDQIIHAETGSTQCHESASRTAEPRTRRSWPARGGKATRSASRTKSPVRGMAGTARSLHLAERRPGREGIVEGSPRFPRAERIGAARSEEDGLDQPAPRIGRDFQISRSSPKYSGLEVSSSPRQAPRRRYEERARSMYCTTAPLRSRPRRCGRDNLAIHAEDGSGATHVNPAARAGPAHARNWFLLW